MMRYLIFLILIVGCSSQHDVCGKYFTKRKNVVFQFNRDSTFFYEWGFGHGYMYSSGTYSYVHRKKIILNSYVNTVVVNLNVKRNNSKSALNIINVVPALYKGNNIADFKCSLFVNDEFVLNRRCDSLNNIIIPNAIKSLYFTVYKEPLIYSTNIRALKPLFTDRYITSDSFGNNLQISFVINDSLLGYQTFNNELIKISSNHVEHFDTYLNKWQKIDKISDNSNLFLYHIINQ